MEPRTQLVAAVILLGFAGCHRAANDSKPVDRPAPALSDAALAEEPAPMTTESLPAEVFLQIRPPSGRVERVQLNGKYLRAEDGKIFVAAEPWSTRATPTPDTLSPGAVARIKNGLTASRFADLPAKLGSTVAAGTKLPPRNAPPRLERWTFTARLQDGIVRTVEVDADPRLPSSFEALEPLYKVLDTEIWGFYRNE